MSGRKDAVGTRSRRSGFGNLVAKHPPFPFISPPLCLGLKGVQKIRTTTRREKKTDNIYHHQLFHGDIDERTRLCWVGRMHAPNFKNVGA